VSSISPSSTDGVNRHTANVPHALLHLMNTALKNARREVTWPRRSQTQPTDRKLSRAEREINQ